jgi:hypothetical protein
MVLGKMPSRIKWGFGSSILIGCVVIALALSGCWKSETDAGLDTLTTTTSSSASLVLFWRGKRQSKKGDETIDC